MYHWEHSTAELAGCMPIRRGYGRPVRGTTTLPYSRLAMCIEGGQVVPLPLIVDLPASDQRCYPGWIIKSIVSLATVRPHALPPREQGHEIVQYA